jgi:hypothetical protein
MAPLTAVLTGTFRNPELRFQFGWGATLPNGKSAQDWVKKLGGRRFDLSTKTWYITGTGTNPDKFFADARIPVDFSEATGDLEGLDTLEPLWRPMVRRSSRFPHMAMVRPRLAGYDRVSTLLGPGATWDKKLQRFDVMLSDLITDDGKPKKGLTLDDETLAAAIEARQLENIPEHVRAAFPGTRLHRRRGGLPINLAAGPGTHRHRRLHTGYLPSWFGLALYPFQVAGAYAIAGGHRALCDAPGLGKTRQALAAAAIVRSRRTVIVVPPLVVENWCREAYAALGPGLKRIQPKVTDPVVPISTSTRSPIAGRRNPLPPKKPD